MSLLIAEPPDFPKNLRVTEKGSRFIKLGWTTSQDGNSPITKYIIEYKIETGNLIFLILVSYCNLIYFKEKGI